MKVLSGALVLVGLLACQGPETSLEQVRALQDAGVYARSVGPLRALLAERPDHPEANYRLGLALVRTGDPSLAVFPLQKAARTEGEARRAGLLLATTLLEIRNFEGAIEAADAVLGLDPEDETALSLRLRAALGANRSAEALAAADHLLVLAPDRSEHLLLKGAALLHLGRPDEAEAIFRRAEDLDRRDPSGASRGRACLVLARFLGEYRLARERAAAKLAECLAHFPDDPSLVPIAADAYDAIERPEQAIALLEGALERRPDDADLRLLLARRWVAAGRSERAEALLREGARGDGDARSWLWLAGVHRSRGDDAAALRAIDEALALAPDFDTARFVRADVLIDLGRSEEAERILARIEQPLLARVLRGRLALERGDPTGALAELGPAIQSWPRNAGARMLAARAAWELGDSARTLRELREASRAEPSETDAALLLAQLQLARGEYAEAAEMARRHIEARDADGAAAHVVAARALAALGRIEEARDRLATLRDRAGGAGIALAEEARLLRSTMGLEGALAFLRENARDLDLGAPESEPALRAWMELEIAAGDARRAATRLDELVATHPDRPRLWALRGQLALAAGDRKAARADFERALASDPDCAPALAGQAELAAAAGRSGEALTLLDRAAAQEPAAAAYGHRAAQIALASGDAPAALQRLRRLRAGHPGHAGIANDLAFLLASRGESLDEALALAEQARRLAPGPEVIDTLGFVQLARGEDEAAASAFREALATRPDYASARYHLGLALARQGDREGAREAFRTALEGGPFPEAEQARRELARLDPHEAGPRSAAGEE